MYGKGRATDNIWNKLFWTLHLPKIPAIMEPNFWKEWPSTLITIRLKCATTLNNHPATDTKYQYLKEPHNTLTLITGLLASKWGLLNMSPEEFGRNLSKIIAA